MLLPILHFHFRRILIMVFRKQMYYTFFNLYLFYLYNNNYFLTNKNISKYKN